MDVLPIRIAEVLVIGGKVIRGGSVIYFTSGLPLFKGVRCPLHSSCDGPPECLMRRTVHRLTIAKPHVSRFLHDTPSSREVERRQITRDCSDVTVVLSLCLLTHLYAYTLKQQTLRRHLALIDNEDELIVCGTINLAFKNSHPPLFHRSMPAA